MYPEKFQPPGTSGLPIPRDKVKFMSFSTLPLSYCCNVHPSETVSELLETLATQTSRVRKLSSHPIAAGLWLADTVSRELIADVGKQEALQQALTDHELICYTLNAFPFGNFHTARVKEQVYLPDWTNPERLQYTLRCARLLSALLPEGTEGSISTVPLGFKELSHRPDFSQQCLHRLIELARELDHLHDDTGRVIRLAIEPEPLCVLETTAETRQFFEQLHSFAEAQDAFDITQRHLGLCYDICHQSVEYEDVAESIRVLHADGIRINKVHITCAVELRQPGEHPDAREFLARFAEPRYLHQTFMQNVSGIRSNTDLSAEFATNPPEDWLRAESWRIHFHVSVHAETIGPLHTTCPDISRALAAVRNLDYAPHLEVETYTWHVLPGEGPVDVCEELAKELNFTQTLLQELG